MSKTPDGPKSNVWIIQLDQVDKAVSITITRIKGEKSKQEFILDKINEWKGQLCEAEVVKLRISGNQSYVTKLQTISLYNMFKEMTKLNAVQILLSTTASTLSAHSTTFKNMPAFITLTVECRGQIWTATDNFNFIDAFGNKDPTFKFRKLKVINVALKCFEGYNIKKLESYKFQTTDNQEFEANLEEVTCADTLEFKITLIDQNNKRAASFQQILDCKTKDAIAPNGETVKKMYGFLYTMEAVVTTWTQCEHILAARRQRNFINHFDVRVSTDEDDSAGLYSKFWTTFRAESKKNPNFNVDHLYPKSIENEVTLGYIEQRKKDLQATFVNRKFIAPLTTAESINVNFIGFEKMTAEVEDAIIDWLMACEDAQKLEIHGNVYFMERINDRIKRIKADALRTKRKAVLPWRKLGIIVTRFNEADKVDFLFADFPALYDTTLVTNNTKEIEKIINADSDWTQVGEPRQREKSSFMAYQFVHYPKIEKIAAALRRDLGQKT